MPADHHVLRTLVRLRVRLSLRSFYHQVKYTLQGKAMVVLLLVASPSLVQILVGRGPLSGVDLDAATRMGVLVFAHAALVLCYCVMIPMLLLRDFVLKRKEEPLLAHAHALPELALVRVVAAIMVSSLFLWVFFYLFFFHILVDAFERPWLALPIHFVAAQGWFFVLGGVLAAVSRRLVLGTRVKERAERVHRLGIVPFLISFPLFIILPDALSKGALGLLTRAGEVAPSAFYFLQPPVALAKAVAGGQPLMFICWATALLFACERTFVVLRRWSVHAPRELPIDMNADVVRQYTSIFELSRRPAGELRRQIWLFWSKDIAAPYLRKPSTYVQLQTVLLTAAIGMLTVLFVAVHRGQLTATAAGAGLTLIAGVVGIVLAMFHSLNSLGRESTEIALLRPVLSPARLLFLKLVVGAVFVTVHAAAQVVLLWTVASALGLEAGGIGNTLVIAMVMGWLFTYVGVSLGFLLPDYRAQSLFLPGASSPAKYIYGVAGAIMLTTLGVARYLWLAGLIDGAGFVGFVAAAVLPLSAGAVLASVWALDRLKYIEQ